MNAIPLEVRKNKPIAPGTSIFVNMDADNSLLKRTIQGDETAFEELFKKYYQRLCTYVYQYVETMSDAEEIVQSTFVKIWEKKSTLDITFSFKSYLYQSVKNRALNAIRGNQRRIKHYHLNQPLEEAPNKSDDTLKVNEITDKLFEGLESLPPKCKKIFQLSRIEGLKHKEIAVRMDVKVKTVENQIGIALKYLRIHLAEYLDILAFIFITSNL